jgi:hypothetical protein
MLLYFTLCTSLANFAHLQRINEQSRLIFHGTLKRRPNSWHYILRQPYDFTVSYSCTVHRESIPACDSSAACLRPQSQGVSWTRVHLAQCAQLPPSGACRSPGAEIWLDHAPEAALPNRTRVTLAQCCTGQYWRPERAFPVKYQHIGQVTQKSEGDKIFTLLKYRFDTNECTTDRPKSCIGHFSETQQPD